MFHPDWYRGAGVADLVKEYYWVLRRALHAHPPLQSCLKRCRHCRIYFLTHPRNAGRRDLRCPFGCREAHRKRQSTQRSVAYYQGEDGKKYRREQNGNRQRTGKEPVSNPLPEAKPEPPARVGDPDAKASPWPTPLLAYLRMVISLIEGRPVSGEEIQALLGRVLRQPSIGCRRKTDHLIERLHEHPP